MSQIDFSRLRLLTARQIIGALLRAGFELERQAGSHRQYYHPDGRRITESYHRPGDTYSLRRLTIMLQNQARRTWDGLRRLGLV